MSARQDSVFSFDSHVSVIAYISMCLDVIKSEKSSIFMTNRS